MNDSQKTRNFSIIAHIDHGKSTLSDSLIKECMGVTHTKNAQILDSMDIERDRNITIKAKAIHMQYLASDNNTYELNLVDTPGHVDFSYEVSRGLAAREGSILVVDATQGIEAQTIANAYLAIENDHQIIVAINKIDLPSANVEQVKAEVKKTFGIVECIMVSAKMHIGIKDLLESIVSALPPPDCNSHLPLRALVIDSWYDNYLGVVVLIRVKEGKISKGTQIITMYNSKKYTVETLGVFTPQKLEKQSLLSGDIGFMIANIRKLSDCFIGDTIIEQNKDASSIEPLPGFKKSQLVVFCGIFPQDASEFEHLKESIQKLSLNDSSFEFTPEQSLALGLGFRCGFLGLLHLEIFKERLEREFNIDIIVTTPTVIYRMFLRSNPETYQEVTTPKELPNSTKIGHFEEPWVEAVIFIPGDFVGGIMNLCIERRGIQKDLQYISERAVLTFHLPLAEIIFDFYDKIKSISRGYASFNWEIIDYRQTSVHALTILINEEPVDALSVLVHQSQSYHRGKAMCEKLKELIPRQLYKIAIQAAVGGKIIARETISAMRKDVTAKCYGGDISRKKKLLEKQKKGKKKMKAIGNIEIPNDIFIRVLKSDYN